MELAARIGTMAENDTPVPPPFDGNKVFGDVEISQLGTDVLLKFKEGLNLFEAANPFNARILAVGGGGGGGGLYRRATASSSCGAGAGGGAGGFVEVTNLFGAATYTVKVGAGGESSESGTSSTKTYLGDNGQPTTITTNGVAMLTALGGGGGGGQCAGQTNEVGFVASGGGSSRSTSATFEGGKGTPGQGHDGGAGDEKAVGAGGGGAGGKGQSAKDGGAGGAGLPSDITGDPITYAVGGGGGKSATKTDGATSDTPGSGGGGAGNTGSTKSAAAGKDGIVYVRIENESIDRFNVSDVYAKIYVKPNAGDTVSFRVEGLGAFVSFGDGDYFITNDVDNLITHTYEESVNASILVCNGRFRISSEVSTVSNTDVVGISSTFLRLKRENGPVFNEFNTAISNKAFSDSTESCHFEIPKSIRAFELSDSSSASAFGSYSVVDFLERDTDIEIHQGTFVNQKIVVSRSIDSVHTKAKSLYSEFSPDWYVPSSMIEKYLSTFPFNTPEFTGTIHQLEGSIYE